MVAPKPNQQQQQKQQQMIALAVATIASAVDYDDDGDDALLSAQVSRLAGLVDADAVTAVVVAVAALPAKFLIFTRNLRVGLVGYGDRLIDSVDSD